MKTIEVIDLANYSYDESIEFMKQSFERRLPLIYRNVKLGLCVDKWKNNNYLYQHTPDKIMSVHVAKMQEMDFKNKNFEYKNMRMEDFIKSAEIENDDKWYYLRALGNDIRKERAHFQEQFPELSQDLSIPPVFKNEDYFSSVFRISSRNCRLWTHYDTMDNILIQVRGKKSIIFYSPFDAEYLYLEDGKSPILCPENYNRNAYPLMDQATPYLAQMDSGDIVFIPALWFHNVLAHEFSVAVNVFWHHLSADCYDKKDVYGNKDPVPVARANQSIDGALKLISSLPEEYRHLYGLNLIKKISSKLLKSKK